MSSDRINILFLGGAKRVSIARMFIEAGKQAGKEVHIYSYELEGNLPVSVVGEIIIGRRWNSPEILAHLHQTVSKYGIDILLPFVDGAVGVVAAYREAYRDIWAPVGEKGIVRDMFDKVASAGLFERAGLPIPQTYSKGKPSLPLIAKPRFGSASKGMKIINNPSDFRDATASKEEYLLQEYVSNSREYTVDCYVSAKGEIICAVPRRRLEVLGGEVSRTVTVANGELESLSRVAVQSLGLRGAITIQFIEDLDTARMLLMEINPRLGGGAVCSIHAGANIPLYIVKEYLGMELTPCADWRVGVEISRYMQEVVFYNGEKQ